MIDKCLTLFREHRFYPPDTEAFWSFVAQSGFWTKRDHTKKHLTIYIPETMRSLEKQKPFLSWYDWLFNFLFIPIIGIHGGFLFQFLMLKQTLKVKVRAFKPKIVTVVGYSQGGAVGLLASMYLKAKRYDVECYTYGSPRVLGWFWYALVAMTRLQVIRVVNKADIVTKVPFAIFGFKHYGVKIQLGRSFDSPVEAHKPDEYLKALRKRSSDV